jgi:hypothetical protein
LALQKQHQNILEGLFFEDNDYDDWIKCAAAKEYAWIQQSFLKNIKLNAHSYLVQMTNDLIEKDNRWT